MWPISEKEATTAPCGPSNKELNMDATPEHDTDQEDAQRGTPFLKTKAGIGVVAAGVVVLGAAAYFALTSGNSDSAETPDPVATASLDKGVSPSPSASATPSESAGPTEGTEGTAGPGGEGSGGQEPGQEATEPGQPADNPATIPGASGPVRVGDHAQGPSIGEWEPVARAYGAAWADPSGGHEAWRERLKPHITPEMYRSFGYTDMANVSARTLKTVILSDEGPRTRNFRVIYEDGYVLLAQVEIQNDGSWLVSQSMPDEG